ncbi:DEAD/DEAH box helicase [Streptomyces kunmingensis]|uniref:DEAD/DEAH box helicase n=1 Tax=Streptomyces kunmingensis TaxID=68225 RepID=A0ABU6CBC5_9ACTN|nr:DEAD/DEAH box helicase [Streptomyces kunmingensis]MEB3961948.1 DEAD/DEAH box helicase [Streptomyces kunmingensis]
MRDTTELGHTVAQIVAERWGVTLDGGGLIARFTEPGWSYEEEVPRACPDCDSGLHALRRPYESAGRIYRYVAVVCPVCPAAYTLSDLGVKTYGALGGRASPPEERERTVRGKVIASSTGEGVGYLVGLPLGPCPTGPGITITPLSVPVVRGLVTPAQPGWPADLAVPTESEERRLLWCKVTDPAWRPSEEALAAADDIRVITPEGPAFADLRALFATHGARISTARHWREHEQVGTVGDLGSPTDLVAHPAISFATTATASSLPGSPVAGPGAHAARDAFEAQWDALAELPDPDDESYVPVGELVPQEWAALLPHATFNPAQTEVVPAVLKDDEHLLVVAPTGAGKTPIGMVAALNAHAQGRKAAWLVPQRSLTDELDRELENWRRRGIAVVRLTGEYAVDIDLIREADVWVATTEKFEALCRGGSLGGALAQVGCLVVDEIHLLGDPGRGAVLEAVLTRVREDSARTRIVGLSATVANADELADWLGARLLRTTWRPTRLTWQIPMLPAPRGGERSTQATAARTAAAVDLARAVTDEGGSVLVFCNSRRGVRATALALAADRGVPTRGADADDTALVERLCGEAGVGLHYRDWPFKREAERAFRARETDVLVATSTVAAGVNLPARAVVVRDVSLGRGRVEVSMVQQMFGRAGRVGAGERDGWAFLLADETERPEWQARLTAGYTVRSRMADRLPDHLLAEVVRGRVASLDQAEDWWTDTFAFHQGHDSVEPLHDAAQYLAEAGYLTSHPDPAGTVLLDATELGVVTSRFMVDVTLAHELAESVGEGPLPRHPNHAERALTHHLATVLPELAEAAFSDRTRAVLRRVLRGDGRVERLDDDRNPTPGNDYTLPGDLAQAVLLLVANSPQAFAGRGGYVLGIPTDSLTGVLEEAQRYLAWLGAQGELGTVHPWIAVAAADLGERVRWRSLGPGRGSGRLLWMCGRMATAQHASHLVPRMWRAARDRGVGAPDWTSTAPPRDCVLPPGRYRALLQQRTTGVVLTEDGDTVRVEAPQGAVVNVWNGKSTVRHFSDGTPARLAYPAAVEDDPSGGRTGAAVFTRGDHRAAGWLAAYNEAEEAHSAVGE